MITRVYHQWSYYTKIHFPSVFGPRYLIVWQPNHVTKIHDHDGNDCTYSILYGKLEENVYGIEVNGHKKYNYKCFDTGFVGKEYKHNMRNHNDNKISISYHIYK